MQKTNKNLEIFYLVDLPFILFGFFILYAVVAFFVGAFYCGSDSAHLRESPGDIIALVPFLYNIILILVLGTPTLFIIKGAYKKDINNEIRELSPKHYFIIIFGILLWLLDIWIFTIFRSVYS